MTFFLGWKGGCWTPPTVQAMTYMADHCPENFIWNTSVMDPVHQWKVLSTAINLGGHIRIGMEDNPFIAAGEYARSTPTWSTRSCASRAISVARVATVEEARKIAAIPKNGMH